MKVVEFIKELEELGFDENTEICFGLYDMGGEWYNCDYEESLCFSSQNAILLRQSCCLWD